MSSNYPAQYDVFPIPGTTSKINAGYTHAYLHRDIGLAIEAIEAELGTLPASGFSTVAARLAYLQNLMQNLQALFDILIAAIGTDDPLYVPGPQGPTGPPGSQGATGAQGDPGPTGAAGVDGVNLAYPSITDNGTTLTLDPSANIDLNYSPIINIGVSQITVLTPTTGTATIDLSTQAGRYLTHDITGNITYATSNRASGKVVTVRIKADGSTRNLTFPAWVFVGAAAPTSIAASKSAILTVTWFGTNETDAVAAYAVQP